MIFFFGGGGEGHVFTLLVRGSPPPDIIYELQRLMHQGKRETIMRKCRYVMELFPLGLGLQVLPCAIIVIDLFGYK